MLHFRSNILVHVLFYICQQELIQPQTKKEMTLILLQCVTVSDKESLLCKN